MEKQLPPEQFEKQKKTNSKIFKYLGLGCLGLIVLFIFITVIPLLFMSSDEIKEKMNEARLEKKYKDSLTLVAKEKANKKEDSINLIEKVNYRKAFAKLKTFRVEKDEFKETEFYSDKRAPKYLNRNFIYPYIGKSGDDVWLKLKYQYYAEDWLFIDNAIFLIDGIKYHIYGVWERDNDSYIYEWYHASIQSESDLIMLRTLANSKSAKIRYVGRQYHRDRVITSKEKSIIKNTLDVYESLKEVL